VKSTIIDGGSSLDCDIDDFDQRQVAQHHRHHGDGGRRQYRLI
jgi:hypothetical protein